MGAMLLIHVTAGGLALLAGYLALFAPKGARVHRGSGTYFFYAMLVMGGTASLIAAMPDAGGSTLGGALPAYLVITGLSAVRPPTPASRRVDRWATPVALGLGATYLAISARALAAGRFVIGEVPVPMILFLGIVALAAGVSDLRALRAGPPRGTRRLVRHLWRMCFAFWMATGSFFLGQADEIPAPLRIAPLLWILASLPLLAIPYGVWRVRAGRRAGEAGADPRAPEAAPPLAAIPG